MATIDPDLAKILDNSQLNDEYSVIDADTIRDSEGNSYRLQGWDAPETAKVFTNDDGSITYKEGTAGGAASLDIMRLAKEQGFTNVVKLDEGAAHGRGLVRLTNDRGEDFATRLIETGVTNQHPASTRQQEDALRVAELFGESIVKEGDEEFAKVGQQLLDSMMKEGYDKLSFKRAAVNEAEYANDPDSFTSNVAFRSTDRNLNNEALSPMSEAWDTALTGVAEAGYGMASLLGDSMGIEGLSELGDQGSARARGRIAENAKFITDYRDVDSFGDAVDYLGNNLAMSVPYMAITMAAMATAAPTSGLSLAAPVSIYTGQVYNEQEEKHAGWAIASGLVQAGLDAVGVKLAISPLGAPKEIFKDGVQAIMKKQGISEAAAANVLSQLTRRQIAELSVDAAKVARDQLTKKRMFLDTAGRMLSASAGEGVTEALQESIAYAGANHDGNNWDWGDLGERALTAAVAGASLGGAFGTAGAVVDKGQWADVAWKLDKANPRSQSNASSMFDEEVAHYGGEEMMPTTIELAEKARQASKAKNKVAFDELEHALNEEGLSVYAELEKNVDNANDTLADKITKSIMGIPKLFKHQGEYIINDDLKMRSRALRELSGMFGGLRRVYNGATYENFKHHLATKYRNMVPDPDKFFKTIGIKGDVNKARYGQEVYTVYKNAIDPTTKKFNPELVPEGPNKQMTIRLIRDAQKAGKAMWSDQKKYKDDLGYIDDYLLKYKQFDKGMIRKNKAEFIQRLMNIEGYDIDRKTASDLTDAIAHNDLVLDLDEAFTVVKGKPTPDAHKSRTLGLSERTEFDMFMDNNIFANMDHAGKSAARFQGIEQFVGTNGSIIVEKLKQAAREGVPQKTINKIGRQFKEYLDAESGNYKRPETDEGKALMAIQKHFLFFTTISSLALSTLSSLPEIMLTLKGLTLNDIFGKNKDSLRSQAEAFAKDAFKIIDGDIDAMYEQTKKREGAGANLAKEVGMFSWDVGASTVSGVTETGLSWQNALKTFFKINGLSDYTDMTRSLRASFAGDFMFNHMGVLLNHPEGQPITNEVQESREQLRNIGMPMDRASLEKIATLLQKPDGELTAEEQAFLMDAIRDPVYNFINDAIALPGSINRPLIYQDPRFALFTQFQGFMATFTANHIPKLWGEYIKRGSPAMKYNAFAMMTGMIMMGFVSQYLKDLLKYGQTTPHLTNAELIRRGVQSSGLLGTYERITSTISPMYDSRSDGTVDWLYKETSGQSPAISKAGQVVGTLKDTLEGDTQNALTGARKLTALPGGLFDAIERTATWNFKE